MIICVLIVKVRFGSRGSYKFVRIYILYNTNVTYI